MKLFQCFKPRIVAKVPLASCIKGGECSSSMKEREPPENKNAVDSVKSKGDSSSKKGIEPPEDQSAVFSMTMQMFSFRDLSTAITNFSRTTKIGVGSFGEIYEGHLNGIGRVAVKWLDNNKLQGHGEFLAEVSALNSMNHPNLVKLISCYAEGEERLRMYEYMPFGNLEDHLQDENIYLDWNTRMKIALGATRGLEHLHLKANPQIIHRDFKSANILLDNEFHPKLSDFGFAKLAPTGDKSHVTTRVMGTLRYLALEYAMTGHLTARSDIYGFGVVLLELITGRRAIDKTRPKEERILVHWARPHLNDPANYYMLVDPRLRGRYPRNGLNEALAVASECIIVEDTSHPPIQDIITALVQITSTPGDRKASPSSSSTFFHSVRIHERGQTPAVKNKEGQETYIGGSHRNSGVGIQERGGVKNKKGQTSEVSRSEQQGSRGSSGDSKGMD